MFSAFISAFASAVEVIQGKYILSKEHVPFKTFLPLECVMIFFFSLFLYFFWGEVNLDALRAIHILIFGVIILVAYFYNYLWTYAIKMGKVCDVEPIAMTYPLFTMLIATVFYPSERNFVILIPALIAGGALLYSRIERHHLKLNKYSLAMFSFAILVAIEQNLVKLMIDVFNPVAFYTIRIGILAVIFLVTLRPNFKKIGLKTSLQMFVNGALIAIEYMLCYTAFGQIGLVNTSLIMLLAPVIILLISNYLFNEKTTIKKAFSDLVIIVCIGVAVLLS